MMKKIVLIVGASGVGKDTLIEAIKNKINANFIQRYITRAPSSSEFNFYLDSDAFKALKEKNFFIASWEAHGNLYGIAKEHIKDGLNIISISRDAICDFEKEFDEVVTIHITIPKEFLFKRLQERGRESTEQIKKRLDRSDKTVEAKNLIEFDNSKTLEVSSENFVTLIKNLSNKK